MAHQSLQRQLDDGLSQAGLSDVTLTQAAICLALDADGARQKVLAARVGISKQALGEQVRALQRAGYVEVRPDPTDRRAKLVQLTKLGWQALEVGAAVVGTFDAWLERRIGRDRVVQLREDLRILAAERPGSEAIRSPQASATAR